MSSQCPGMARVLKPMVMKLSNSGINFTAESSLVNENGILFLSRKEQSLKVM